MTVVAIVFWVAVALLVYTQVGYALLLALLDSCEPLRTAGGRRLERRTAAGDR